MIASPNTIVYPLTMVIEFTDAPITDVAVTAVHSVCCLTVRAEGIRIKFFNKLLELKIGHTPDVAWIEESCFTVT